MSRAQKFAWFNLAVAVLASVLVLLLVPLLGWHRANGGISLLALTALGPLLFRKPADQVDMDERDLLIQRRSQTLAHAVFWLFFVAVAVGVAPAIYGWDGAVPVSLVQSSIWWAWIIVQCVASIGTLVQYSGATAHDE